MSYYFSFSSPFLTTMEQIQLPLSWAGQGGVLALTAQTLARTPTHNASLAVWSQQDKQGLPKPTEQPNELASGLEIHSQQIQRSPHTIEVQPGTSVQKSIEKREIFSLHSPPHLQCRTQKLKCNNRK